jgi:predicted nuclease of predicted toxin-antitoxin system
MRIIADENISWRLKKLIPNWNILPSNEIKASERLSDLTIWKFAKSNNYSILNSMKILLTSKICTVIHQKLFGYGLAM